MNTRKYYVTVGGDDLIALDVETAHLLGRNRDVRELHAHVQHLFPGIAYSPLDEERVRQYVAAQGASPIPVPERLPVAARIYCAHCGTENVQGVNFCWKCGSRLGATLSTPSPSEGHQVPLPVVIIRGPKASGWFRTNLPHILAVTGGLLFLLFFTLPIKEFSIFGVVLRSSRSGYDSLQGGYGAFAVAIAALTVSKVVQQVRGKQFRGQERYFASYATIAVLTIILVIIMYAGTHLYDGTTGKQVTDIDETIGGGTLFSIGSVLIILAGGIIEIRRYLRADAAVPQSDTAQSGGFHFFRKKATKPGTASQPEKNLE